MSTTASMTFAQLTTHLNAHQTRARKLCEQIALKYDGPLGLVPTEQPTRDSARDDIGELLSEVAHAWEMIAALHKNMQGVIDQAQKQIVLAQATPGQVIKLRGG